MSDPGEDNEEAFDPPAPWSRGQRIAGGLSGLYLIGVVAAWIFLRYMGDRSWFGAIAIFSPRWVALLPAIPIAALAFVYHRRSLWVVVVTALVAVFGLMGFCLPWRDLLPDSSGAASIRLLTCNLHGHAVQPRKLAELIATVNPDVVVLQEWTPPYDEPIFEAGKWTVITTGEMCLASKFPVEESGEVENAAAVHYTLKTPNGEVELLNVHFASPHFPLRDAVVGLESGRQDLRTNIEIREREARDVSQLGLRAVHPMIIAGDFNLCPDSPIFRGAFGDFTDAFAARGFGFGWSYSNGWTITRIDHVLLTNSLRCESCWLGPKVGSPHRPLIADISVVKSR